MYLTCDNGKPDGMKNITGNNGNYNHIKSNLCSVGEDLVPPQLTIKCDGDDNARGVEDDNFDGEIYYYSATNTEGDKRIPELTVEVSDTIAGLEKNQYVTYEWKMYPNKETAEVNPEYTEKNKTTFNVKDGDTSIAKKKVRIIEQFKKTNTTGKAIVDIRGTNIVDRIGNRVDPKTKFKQCYYYYDNVKPKITITLTGAGGTNYNIDGNEWINEPITTSVTVTDQTPNNIYSGIKIDTFKRNGGNEPLSGEKPTHTFSRNDTNRKETDEYRVCDKVGNCDTDTVNIRVDTTPTVCGEASTNAATPWINRSRTVSIGCSDNLSGCTQNSYSETFGEGTTEIITIRDNAGNTTDCTVYTKVDKTKPVCRSSGGDIGWRKDPLTIKGTCTDNLSGCVKTTYTKQYSGNTNILNGFGGRACDVAGNCDDCSKDQEVHIDTTSPSCTIEVSNENNPNMQVVGVVKCSDNYSITECDKWAVGASPYHGEGRTFVSEAMAGVTSGTYRKHVKDAAGHTAYCSVTVVESTCNKCPETCCPHGLHRAGNLCCAATSFYCLGLQTCYTGTCTSGQYCGYHAS